MPPPGPATPVTETATSTSSRARAPCAIASATSADTAPCVLEKCERHAEQRLLHRVRVRDDPAAKDIAAARDVGEALGHESSSARLRSAESEAAGTARVEDQLLDRSLVSPEQEGSDRLEESRLELVRPCLRARLDDHVDVNLEIARTDRHLDAVAVTPGLGEGLRNERLADAVEASNAATGTHRSSKHLLHGR